LPDSFQGASYVAAGRGLNMLLLAAHESGNDRCCEKVQVAGANFCCKKSDRRPRSTWPPITLRGTREYLQANEVPHIFTRTSRVTAKRNFTRVQKEFCNTMAPTSPRVASRRVCYEVHAERGKEVDRASKSRHSFDMRADQNRRPRIVAIVGSFGDAKK